MAPLELLVLCFDCLLILFTDLKNRYIFLVSWIKIAQELPGEDYRSAEFDSHLARFIKLLLFFFITDLDLATIALHEVVSSAIDGLKAI